MNVLRLATNACDRGDFPRAVIMLARALRRQADVDDETFDMLINTYANCCSAPGLEAEVCESVARHFDAGFISGQIVARLEDRGLWAMVGAFRREIEARGVWIEPVEFVPDEPPLPQTEELARDVEHVNFDTSHDLHEPIEDLVEEPRHTAELPRVSASIDPADGPTLDLIESEPLLDEPTPEDPIEDAEGADSESLIEESEPLPDEPVEVASKSLGALDEDLTEPEVSDVSDEPVTRPQAKTSTSSEPIENEAEVEPSEVREDAERNVLSLEEDEPVAGEHAEDDPVEDEARSPSLTEDSEPMDVAHVGEGSRASARPRKPRTWAIALFVTTLFALAGAIGYMSISRSAQLRAIDQQLEMFDPLHPEGFEAAIERGRAEGEDVSTRELFIKALLALERGQDFQLPPDMRSDEGLPTRVEDVDTWEHGAKALVAMRQQDFERAVQHVVVIERARPEELAPIWVRARLEEERGAFGAAAAAYERALDRYPRFVPAVVGRIRIAYRVHDERELERATALLRALNPIHPYLRISEQPILELERDYLSLMISGHEPAVADAAAISSDRFLSAYHHYHVARRAWRRGDLSGAREEVAATLAHDAHFAPALLLDGVLRALAMEHDVAGGLFSRLSRIDGLTPTMRLMVMIVAPRVFSQTGRPDLGFTFTLELPEGEVHALARDALAAEDRARYDTWRAVSLSLTREQLDGARDLAELASREAAQVFLDMGDGQRCLAALAELEERGALAVEARLIRLLAFFMMGERQRLADAVYHLKGEPEEHIAQTIMHLLEGDWEAAQRSSSSNGEQMKRHPFWLRVRALALLARERPEEILQLVDGLEISPMFEQTVARLRLRAWAKTRAGDEHYERILKTLSLEKSTHVHALIDLGAAAFWRGQMEVSRGWLERALERSPRHPEANWFMGLILRHEGNRKASLQHLALASVETEDDPRLLLQLGQVYLELGRNMLAQKMFYKAVLLDRKDLRAIRGLGRSYVGWNTELGKRDLTRILASYENQSGMKAQAAEVLRWLAVLHGSRRGLQGALPFLDRAIAQAGPLGELLVEKAIYFERIKKYEQARKLHVKALRRDSTLSSAHVGLARIALRTKDRRTARDHLVKYLELDPYGESVDWAREQLEALIEESKAGDKKKQD